MNFFFSNLHYPTPSQCLRVGITGGIGSGKSTICSIFGALGISTYNADYWAKWLIVNDINIKTELIYTFGEETYLPDGSYNRNWISKIVFEDSEKLKLLNAIVHPKVELHWLNWHKKKCEEGAQYTMKEAALLIESGIYKNLDKLIVITAPDEIRLKRTLDRDNSSEYAVRARMNQQMPDSEKLKFSDFIIVNNGEISLIDQILHIHQKLIGIFEKNRK